LTEVVACGFAAGNNRFEKEVVAIFNGKGIALLQEEHHQFGTEYWLRDHPLEIGNSLFSFCELQQAIALHIWK
jgi:hypothetical protein